MAYKTSSNDTTESKTANKKIARYSNFWCPYGWDLSAGFWLILMATNAITLFNKSVSECSASARITDECVNNPTTSLVRVSNKFTPPSIISTRFIAVNRSTLFTLRSLVNSFALSTLSIRAKLHRPAVFMFVF